MTREAEAFADRVLRRLVDAGVTLDADAAIRAHDIVAEAFADTLAAPSAAARVYRDAFLAGLRPDE